MSRYRKFTTICCAAVFALGLAACGGGSSPVVDDAPPPPTPYEVAVDEIAAATTAADAQAAYDAVKDDVTAAQGEKLQMAVDARIMAINTMARADAQKMALSDAAGMIDTSDLSTQDLVDAARMAIAGLRQAIADAVDVADTSMYQSQLDTAVMAVDEAQGGIDTDTRRTNQMAALEGASGTLQAALTALSGSTPTQEQLDAANAALAALNTAIADGADLTDDEKAPYQHEADNAAAPINTAQMAFDDAEDENEKTRNAAMAATAAKLYAGISAPTATDATPEADIRFAAYNDDEDAISVQNGVATADAQELSEDKKTAVAGLHGWEGKQYTASGMGVSGTYEARVYSNVGEPTQGKKFGSDAAVADPPTGDYQYQLDAADRDGNTNKALTIVPATHAARISLPGVTRTAGTETFKLPEQNPGGQQFIPVSGMLHGVSGTFSCQPTTPADGCTAAVAARGFTLGGGTWLFIPSNPEARVTESPDANYASYGWWLHKSEDGKTYTASAFHDYRGTDAGAVGIADLRGSATYEGGAAGKYALRSLTGGTNDAGHFTADVELTATFAADHMISGTIDNFVGADNEMRDWSVALGKSVIADTGGIAGDPETAGNTDLQMTTWTIGGTAAAAGGEWSGELREQGSDGVPAIATGTFSATYGLDGNMVGAFGANKQ